MTPGFIVYRKWLIDAFKYISGFKVSGWSGRKITLRPENGYLIIEFIPSGNFQFIQFKIPACITGTFDYPIKIKMDSLYRYLKLTYDEYETIPVSLSNTLDSISIMNDLTYPCEEVKDYKHYNWMDFDYNYMSFHTSVDKLVKFCSDPFVNKTRKIDITSGIGGQHIRCDEYLKQICNYPTEEKMPVILNAPYLLQLIKPLKRDTIIHFGVSFYQNEPGIIRITDGQLQAYLAPRWTD
jgi:hypothetical protein